MNSGQVIITCIISVSETQVIITYIISMSETPTKIEEMNDYKIYR